MPEIKEKKIKDFRAGDTVQGFFYIRESEMKQTTNNNRYMNFTFSDNTGDVNAKLWDADEENPRRFPAGVIVKARGTVIDWQGQPQFKLELIRRTTETDRFAIEDYIPSAPEKGEDLYRYIKDTVAEMEDLELADFVSHLLNKYEKILLHFPAAKKNHHAVRDGLMYHTGTMLKAAKALVQVYPFVNKDLLYAGVILHDIGKIQEMDASELGLVNDYTAGGKLLGHLIQGITMIHEAAKETGFNEEKMLVLEHMILSHHYEPEYGSPKYPMLPEGELLHYLDIIDARMYDMKKISEGCEPGTFSERIWSLENRNIYRPTWN
jgi:3'-5' exoribonuclease